MNYIKILFFILKIRLTHFGEIYRLISLEYFIKINKIDLKNLSILDVGFNKGLFRWYFNTLHGCTKYVGIEVDQRFLGKYPNTFFHDFESNKYTEKYDLIFCSHVLEHVENDYKFLNNLVHSLDINNGLLLLRVPKPTSKRIYFRVYNSKRHNHMEHHRDGYKTSDINTLFSKVGLKVEKYYYSMNSIGIALHTLFEIFRDYQFRFQRILQLPYFFFSIIDIYLLNKSSSSDLIVLGSRLIKK